MTISYSIQPNPHWVIIDNFSKLPDGAAIYTYRSLDPTTFKPAFQDAGGTIPYGQPIVGFGNGTMPPIFWSFDTDNPTDTYYIRVYDSDDTQTQQFLWDFNGLSGAGGGGGGTVITANNIQNFVINGVFYRNIGNQAAPLPTSVTIAPSNNAGYVNDAANITFGPTGPDIIFAKNNATGTDTLSFIDFSPLGTNDLNPDVTPEQFLRYACTGPGAGETYKYVQFPISQGVQSLSEQTVTVKLWARCNSGNSNISISLRQFYGSGGAPSADQVSVINTINLSASWTSYQVTALVPDATTKTPGTCGNDALFLQINLPFDAATSIDFVKPSFYLGGMAPQVDYATNDMIDSIINTPRTGDVRTSLNSFLPGWILMDDGTIGSASSGSSSRANIDTFPLFDLIWNAFQGNQTLAPMFTSGGAGPVAYGASSVIDFATNNRRLSLTKEAGRVMAGISGSHVLGTSVGAETVVLTTANLPATDGVSAISGYIAQAVPGTFALQSAAGTTLKNIAPSGTAVSILQPTVYMNVFIKL
jgi:hypothetical protein